MTRYQVASGRLPWPFGATVSAEELASVNVDALMAGGHLVRAVDASRSKKTRRAEAPAAPLEDSAQGAVEPDGGLAPADKE